MKKIYLKTYRSDISNSQTKGELAAKSIEDKIIIREQILDGLKDFKAKGREITVLPPEKAPHFRTVTAGMDGVVIPTPALENTPELIVF